jgi:hypothetical protein
MYKRYSRPGLTRILFYFLKGNDYTRLPVIENYDYLRNIHVPHGVFLNSKILSTRTDRFAQYSDENEIYDDPAEPNSVSPDDCPIPSGSPMSSMPSSPSYPPRHHRSLPSSFSREGSQRISLPPISTLGPTARRPSFNHPHRGGPSADSGSPVYLPLSTEDRRVLDSFRVIL